jgi:hypothetical protein
VEARKHIVDEFVDGGRQAATSPIPVVEPFASRLTGIQGLLASALLSTRAEKASYAELLAAMEARVDKQVGAPAAGGGTSLTTKGAVPQILGAAVEVGALEKSTNGTTVTFRAKPLGVVKFLQSRGVLDMYADYSESAGARLAKRFSASASFDTSRGPSSGTFTASGNQLSAWSVRAEIVNQRDPALSGYAKNWRALLKDTGKFAAATGTLQAALGGWPSYQSWLKALHDKVAIEVDAPFRVDHDLKKAQARFRTLLEEGLPALDQLSGAPPAVEVALDAYVAELTTLESGVGGIYAFANKGALLTAEFATVRDVTLPDLQTATAVLATGLGAARKTDLTVNAEASYYRSVPTGATRKLKNVAFSAELAHPLGSFLGMRGASFSLAARYSYLPDDTVAPAAAGGAMVAPDAAAAPKGSIGSVQAKVTLPVKGSGVKVPLSITFANRTEAIKERIVRANFGVTLDLDTLLAAAKAR